MSRSGNTAARMQPDVTMIRRSAFDFLQSKGAIGDVVMFTDDEARARISSVKLAEFGRPDDDGTEVFFLHRFRGLQVIFDEHYTVLGYRRLRGADITLCHEKLNIAERMEMVAFPLLCVANTTVEPTSKRARLEQKGMYGVIPDECFLRVLSFTVSMQDILPILQVCKPWRSLLDSNMLRIR